MRRFSGGAVFAVFLAMLLAFGQNLYGQTSAYKLKTAFIFQFTKYIEWPNFSADSPGPFVIAIVGSSPIAEELEELTSKTVKGKPIQLIKTPTPEQLKKSNIVVLTAEANSRLVEILHETKGSSSLIISESDGFAKKGAMINFIADGERLKFEMNRKALETEKLQVSSQLLKLAKIVD